MTTTTAAAIGWPGNDHAVVACLSGSFVVKNSWPGAADRITGRAR